jgi:hypothetical protein
LFRNAAEEINSSEDSSRSIWEMQDGGDWKAWRAEMYGEVDFEELAASETGIAALGLVMLIAQPPAKADQA